MSGDSTFAFLGAHTFTVGVPQMRMKGGGARPAPLSPDLSSISNATAAHGLRCLLLIITSNCIISICSL